MFGVFRVLVNMTLVVYATDLSQVSLLIYMDDRSQYSVRDSPPATPSPERLNSRHAFFAEQDK